jgi:hypothetical protein
MAGAEITASAAMGADAAAMSASKAAHSSSSTVAVGAAAAAAVAGCDATPLGAAEGWSRGWEGTVGDVTTALRRALARREGREVV